MCPVGYDNIRLKITLGYPDWMCQVIGDGEQEEGRGEGGRSRESGREEREKQNKTKQKIK